MRSKGKLTIEPVFWSIR